MLFAIVATAAFAGAQSGNLGNAEINGTDDSLKVWIGKDVTAYLQTMMKMRSTAKVTEIKRGSKSVDVMFAKNLPKDIPHVFISSISGEGLQQLKDILWQELHS